MKRFFQWVEIPANDFERAVKFYQKVFKIELKVVDCGREQMAFFPNGEGAISKSPGFSPSESGTLVSINVADQLDETIACLTESGGKLKIPKTKIDAESKGYFATFIDSEGNHLGLYGDPL